MEISSANSLSIYCAENSGLSLLIADLSKRSPATGKSLFENE